MAPGDCEISAVTDLYADLGIKADASPEEIKQAYRKRARETHPDHGGSEEEFQKVNAANIVLSDPEKREKYDRTGDTEQTPTAVFIVGAFDRAVKQSAGQWRHIDLTGLMKKFLRDDIREGDRVNETMATDANNMRDMLKRLKKSPVIRKHLENRIVQAERNIASNKATQDTLWQALTEIEESAWDIDEAPGFMTVKFEGNTVRFA